MTTAIILVLVILAIAVVLLVTEWMPMEVTALLTLGAVALTGLVPPAKALTGFSNPAVVTVWAVFILSGGLTRTGVANRLGRHLLHLAGTSEARMIAVIMLASGVLSALMNNVAVAAMLLPVTMDIARRIHMPPSRLLMPLAYGSLLGGLTTLIGTPPNILVSDALRDAGMTAVPHFRFHAIGHRGDARRHRVRGLHRTIPAPEARRDPRGFRARRAGFARAISSHGAHVFLLRVPHASPLAGKSLAEIRIGTTLGLQVLGINRRGQQQLAPPPSQTIEAGDALLVSGRLERLEKLRGWRELTPSTRPWSSRSSAARSPSPNSGSPRVPNSPARRSSRSDFTSASESMS